MERPKKRRKLKHTALALPRKTLITPAALAIKTTSDTDTDSDAIETWRKAQNMEWLTSTAAELEYTVTGNDPSRKAVPELSDSDAPEPSAGAVHHWDIDYQDNAYDHNAVQLAAFGNTYATTMVTAMARNKYTRKLIELRAHVGLRKRKRETWIRRKLKGEYQLARSCDKRNKVNDNDTYRASNQSYDRYCELMDQDRLDHALWKQRYDVDQMLRKREEAISKRRYARLQKLKASRAKLRTSHKQQMAAARKRVAEAKADARAYTADLSE